jgi:adenylyltransferase/sulfurtransferase
MVNEAIKLITGVGEPLIGRLMVYDALEMSYTTLKVQRDPTTEAPTELLDDYEAFCGIISDEAAEAASGSTISVHTLSSWLKEQADGGRDLYLVDVREPVEHEINRIEGSVLIPPAEFRSGAALEKLPSDKQLVLYCKTGNRSAEALSIVKGAGYADAVHVGGGMSAWVNQIDPSQPAY